MFPNENRLDLEALSKFLEGLKVYLAEVERNLRLRETALIGAAEHERGATRRRTLQLVRGGDDG
jgi:hypothetical protein